MSIALKTNSTYILSAVNIKKLCDALGFRPATHDGNLHSIKVNLSDDEYELATHMNRNDRHFKIRQVRYLD